MAVTFPTTPTNGQTFTANGLSYVYNATHGVWRMQTSTGSVTSDTIHNLTDVDTAGAIEGSVLKYNATSSAWEIGVDNEGSGGGGGGVTSYTLVSELPVTGNLGDLAYVTDNQRLYLWNGTVWFHILTAETPNTAPFITTQPKVGYSLSTDGTPLVLTLNATDPEGTAITWGYTVTGGTLGNSATISISNNTFTITPSTDPADTGEFELTFTASDGLHVTNTNPAYFSLVFSYDWITSTQVVENSFNNPAWPQGSITYTNTDSTTLSFGAAMKYWNPNELFIGSPGDIRTDANGAIWIYDTSTSPATLIGQYGIARGSGVDQGANFGMIIDVNDEWLVAASDENLTGQNATIIFFKRNASNGFDTDGTEELKLIPTFTSQSMTFTMTRPNNITIALDENSNTLAVTNNTSDDLEIFTYNDQTLTWDSVGGIIDAFFIDVVHTDILDHYVVGATGTTTNTLQVVIKDPVTGWQKNQTYTCNVKYPAYLKIFNWNGNYYIVVVGASDPTSTDSYSIELLSIDEASKAITSLTTIGGTAAGGAATSANGESDLGGNLFNYNFADAYLSGDILHILATNRNTTTPSVKYITYNMATSTAGTLTNKIMSNLPTTPDMTKPASVAMDRFTGKMAISESDYSGVSAGAGKVWILR